MAHQMDAAGTARLGDYFSEIGRHLKDKRKRESFAMYAFGLFGDGERKSAEPIAARAGGEPLWAQRYHNKLLHFLAYAQWSDEAVRGVAARYAVEALSQREPVTTWIVDDTGFPKQGDHSVGVQRQYTGTVGKLTNCQIGVSLAIATATEQVPIDFELYLPQCWAADPKRRREARIPAEVQFRTKIDLALGMINKAVGAGIPGQIILADAAYGNSCEFRDTVSSLGFDHAVAVQSTTKVRRIGKSGQLGAAFSVAELARHVAARHYRKVTWRQATKTALNSRFHFCRVKTTHDDGTPIEDRQPLWLVIEWPSGEPSPTKFFLTTLPRRLSKKKIVRIIKERWRTERMYEDLKGELGLDHFEGRSYPGWHHHVSVVLCCYAFIVAERVRAFPPAARRQNRHRPLAVAA